MTGGNRDSTLGGHTQSSVRTRTQGKLAVTPQETESDPPARVEGSPAEAGGRLWLTTGTGYWEQKFWEVLIGVSPHGAHN